MESVHHDAPEVVQDSYPEVVHQPAPQYTQGLYPNQYTPSPGTPQPASDKFPSDAASYNGGQSIAYGAAVTADPSVHGGGTASSATLPSPEKPRKTIFGCGMLVFVLSAIIGVLSVAVIGLAAGTGVEANRAASAESRADELAASISALEATATADSEGPEETNFDAISNNCSTQADKVSGTIYTPQFFNKPTYKLYCNSDTPLGPLMSLFTSDFNNCMDACASYTDSLNTTCAAVSFIPAWTNKTFAIEGTAPGNCYLKPAPQNTTGLYDSSWIEVHAAILDE